MGHFQLLGLIWIIIAINTYWIVNAINKAKDEIITALKEK